MNEPRQRLIKAIRSRFQVGLNPLDPTDLGLILDAVLDELEKMAFDTFNESWAYGIESAVSLLKEKDA